MTPQEAFAAALERANEAGLDAEVLYEWLIEADREDALEVLRAHLRAEEIGKAFIDAYAEVYGGEPE